MREYALPEIERADFLYRKIITDGLNGIFVGTWYSLFWTVFGSIFFASAQTIAAGFLLRRRGKVIPILVPYLELSAAAVGVGFGLMSLFAELVGQVLGNPLGYPWATVPTLWVLAAALVAAPVVVIGVLYWRWLFRLTLYAACFFTVMAISGAAFPIVWPWYVAAVSTLAVCILLAHYYERSRHRSAALPV